MALKVETFQALNNVLEDSRYSIARCCQAVEYCLESNEDNLRGFFEQCFTPLIKHIFGYDGSSWLNIIAKGDHEQDAKALVALLSPNGLLFQAIGHADADNVIKFEFPLTRLPTHTQQLMRGEAGRRELERWPQYQKHIIVDSRGNCQVHLNVFEYFVFWTAFYVLRSSQTSGDYQPEATPRGYGHLAPSLGTVRKALGVKSNQPLSLRQPYLRLLRRYLEHFLPRSPDNQTPKAHRGFQSPARHRVSDGNRAARGHVLLSVLVEFWLTDGDEPLPVLLESQGSEDALAWNSTGSLRLRAFQPPSDDLIDALTILVRYVVAFDDKTEQGPQPAQAAPWLPNMPAETLMQQQARAVATVHAPGRLGAHAAAPAQAFGRRLFRFLLRALLFWPEQQSLGAVVQLWLVYIVPWRGSQTSLHLWESHVLANIPFYSMLFSVFLDLLRSRVSSRGDAALRDLIKVLQALKGSPRLLQLLKVVESDLARFTRHAGRRPEGPHADILPFLVDQVQDWKSYALASQSPYAQVTGDAVHGSLFGTEEGSAATKARDLLNAAAGAAKQDLLKEAQSLAESVLPLSELPPLPSGVSSQQNQPLEPIRGLKRSTWEDLQYKGDWMRRPLSSSEIGWLVRLLLSISDTLNRYFQLDQPPPPNSPTPLPRTPKGFGIWLRKRGWRINLRFLGEKQMLLWLPIVILLVYLSLHVMSLLVREFLAALH